MKKQIHDSHGLPLHSPFYGALVGVVRAALFVLTGTKFVCDDRVKELKKSEEACIVVCQHPSMLDAAVLYAIMAPRKIHTVAGRFQYIGKKSQFLFEMLGVIPKRQFYTDIACVRSMLGVLKQNRVLAFMPEGRISMDGTMSPIEETTAAFLKKCAVPVAAVQVDGSYFVMGSWRKRLLHLGKVQAKASIVFEKEDLEKLEAEEIREKLEEALSYNQFAQGQKRRKYWGRAHGISTMLYRCKACGAVGTFSDNGKSVACEKCGFTMHVGRDRFFYPVKNEQIPFDNLADYNAWQKQQEMEFWAKDNACLAYPATCKCRDDSGAYIETVQGILRLDKEKLVFENKAGEELFSRAMAQITGVSADYTRQSFTMYEKNGAREFHLPAVYCIAQIVNSIVVLHEKSMDGGANA